MAKTDNSNSNKSGNSSKSSTSETKKGTGGTSKAIIGITKQQTRSGGPKTTQ
ncbi:hypothetical protein [Chryseobacterium sp. CFS15]|uniref:hypothetical protein n=1 Tax=Chryseobacterium sp. CFS15 TaxID=2986946 RepID=UPI00280760BD|nr:hypothetical protein [Chryseobacterium sp. CFS15]MDQ8144345.1 hypothetical protein [Chryseobacterium sp. CFS15]